MADANWGDMSLKWPLFGALSNGGNNEKVQVGTPIVGTFLNGRLILPEYLHTSISGCGINGFPLFVAYHEIDDPTMYYFPQTTIPDLLKARNGIRAVECSCGTLLNLVQPIKFDFAKYRSQILRLQADFILKFGALHGYSPNR